MKKLILLLFILPSLAIFAEEVSPSAQSESDLGEQGERVPDINFVSRKLRDKLALKGGFGFINRKIRAQRDTEDTFRAGGFNTHFVYTHDRNWELLLSSYIYFGKTKDLTFDISGNTVEGNGKFRSATFAPMLKFVTDWEIQNKWYFYVTGGPAWGIQTLKLTPFKDFQGNVRSNHKLTYESAGGVFGIGLQELLPYKEMHAVYVEFLFSYMKANKVSLVDASDFTEVNTISYEDQKKEIDGTIFMLNFGMVIF